MLETKKVFIDTQCFREAGYNFEKGNLAEFAELAGTGSVEYISTFVVDKEVTSQIKEKAAAQISAARELEKKASRCSVPSLFTALGVSLENLAVEDYINSACVAYEEFKKRTNAVILNGEEVNLTALFDSYISGEAPFSSGKKKNEFPDAFSLAAIEASLNEKDKVYVLSGDGDLKNAVKGNTQLLYLEKISEFLDLFNKENTLYSLVTEEFDKRKLSFENGMLYYLNGLRGLVVSEIEGASVLWHTFSECAWGEPFVTSVDEESAKIDVDFSCKIEIEVELPASEEYLGAACVCSGRSSLSISSQTVTDQFNVTLTASYDFKNGKLENLKFLPDYSTLFPTGDYPLYIDRYGRVCPSPSPFDSRLKETT